ncbi:hypothetical protein Tco_0237880 [Tanacetum coccineum]
MTSMNTRLNIEKLDGNIVQKHGGSKQVGLKQLGSKQVGFKQLGHKQVGFKQLGPGVETGFHGVQDEKRVWFEAELQGAQEDREAEVFQVSNDDTTVAQRRLGDKQPEEKTNTDCLVKEQEKVHLGIKVGANITVTGVPGQEGAEGNVAGKKKVKESMKANLGKLLKYNAWSTRWSPIRALVSFFTDDEWSSSCVRVAKSVALRIPLDINSLRAVECISVVCGHTKQLRSVEDEEEGPKALALLALPLSHYCVSIFAIALARFTLQTRGLMLRRVAVKPLFFFKAQMIDYCSHAKTGCRINRAQLWWIYKAVLVEIMVDNADLFIFL